MKSGYSKLIKYNIKNILCLRNIVYTILSIAGAFLTVNFLISEKWMSSPRHYDKELGHMVYKFNLGFQWTTMLGMLGVILLVFGIQSLVKKEKYVMASAVFTLFIIHVSAWDYLLLSSKTYFELVLELDNKIMLLYFIFLGGSVISTAILLAVIFGKQMDKRRRVFYRIAVILSFLCLLGCIVFKTICNQWYLLQALLTVCIVICLFEGRLRYQQYRKKKRYEGWKVISKTEGGKWHIDS